MTTAEKLIKNKLGLLQLASYLQNVSEACRVMGYSRDTFYRVKKAHDEGGIEALKEKNRRKPNIRNRVSEDVEQAVVELSFENPSYGQKRASDTLRQRGIFISAAGVRCVWLRHNLQTFQLRLKALEKRVAETGEVLEAQLDYLSDHGFTVVPLADVIAAISGDGELPDPYYGDNLEWNITPNHRVQGTYFNYSTDLENNRYEWDSVARTRGQDSLDPGEPVTHPARISRQGLVSRPMPSTSTRMTSPSCSVTRGSRNQPTPAGVPVQMTSPGSSVNACEQYEMR